MFLLSKEYWEVKETPKKGRGVFAKKDIPAGTVIGDYTGKLIRDIDFNESSYGTYDMYFTNDISILADKNTVGVHLINHSCSSNCDTFPYQDHALYFACRHIFPGEELTIQYLLDPPEKDHVCTHICYCDSPVCHGTMHTNIATAKNAEKFIKSHTKKHLTQLPIKIGEDLPLLKSYPKNIHDYPIYDLYGCLSQKPLEILDEQMPSIEKIRNEIREKGRILYCKKLNFYIYGVMNGLVIGTEKLSKLFTNNL